jgi:signal transduction histidine kinase
MRVGMRRSARPGREPARSSPPRGARTRAIPEPGAGVGSRAERVVTLGELAVGVAHDLCNQLAVARSCATYLGELPALDPAAREALQDLSLAVERSIEMTRSVVELARGASPRPGPVDLHHVLERTVALLGRAVGRRHRVAVEAAARTPVVDGDPADLQNALLNLGLNAADAMPGGGAVVFSTSDLELGGAASGPLPPGSYVRVVVADEGAGIAPADLARVFEPFFTTKPGGTGLGLATVRAVVQRHRGAIDVVSGSTGTTFVILLPRAAPGTRDRTGPRA